MRSLFLAAALLFAGSAAPAPALAAARSQGQLDAFLAGPVGRPLSADPSAMAEQGVQIAHTERRLGVPSMVFAEAGRFPPLAGSPEGAARRHLQGLAELYRLSPAAIEVLPLAGLHDVGEGAVIASFRAQVGSVEVFRHEIDVVMNRKLELVAVSVRGAAGRQSERILGARRRCPRW